MSQKTKEPNASPLCFSAMSGVFPGAESVDALWPRILNAEVAPLVDMTPRWGIAHEALYAAEPGTANRAYLERAYALPLDVAASTGTDPLWGRQLNLTHRVIHDLLTQAEREVALPRRELALVLGTSWSDDSYFLADAGLRAQGAPWFDPDTQLAELQRRLGLGGPAASVDTACSSFTYALDTAAALIRSGQARGAVVAGVNAFLPPTLFLGFSQLRALDASGRLRAFAEDAAGIVPGECVAAFLVEPLDEALRAGRRPLGVLRGLGISSDGAEGSVFAPGCKAQIKAYERAWLGLNPADVDYIEAHGTGTPVGDGTELQSLSAFFSGHLEAGRRIPVGSIKALIGHTLAAAGAASLVKALLMLRHRQLPPHVAVRPQKKMADGCLSIATEAQALAPRERPMRVAVSSFGFGGANAHFVVEDWQPQAEQPGLPALQPLNLAVVDVEAAFAGASSAHDWQRQRAAGHVSALQSPPADRFANLKVAPGRYLRGEQGIDIAGYRMGPKALSHIDAYKLLLTHRARTLHKRVAADGADTALIVCANMGGERFFDACRKSRSYFAEGGAAPDIVVNDVATMLPTMLSGYPAQIMDLRGFHQTLSGSPGLFWSTLQAAPHWLASRCRTLLLGAGRYLSAPADAAGLGVSAQPVGEGIGLLALKTAQAAAEDGDRVLAYIRHWLPASRASTLAEARAAAGLGESDEAHHEICQLSAQLAASDGSAQSASGFLNEGAGIETLLAAIVGGATRHLIEVRRGTQTLFWLLVEKQAPSVLPADPPAQLPYTITFPGRDEVLPVAANEPAVERAAVVASITPPVAHTRAALSDSWQAAALEELGRTLSSSVQLRARAIELLRAGHAVASNTSLDAQLAALRRNTSNRVITAPRLTPEGIEAQLVVDEQQPYFFDHALDHVPGILLLEGVLQLAELHERAQGKPRVFVRGLRARFKRYTEKETPALISLQVKGSEALAVVKQDGHIVCECDLVLGDANAQPLSVSANAPRQIRPGRRLLHKSREDNVLVTTLEDEGAEMAVHTLPVPATHLFSDGDATQHSMLYFLEVARQCFMQVAHERLRIPFGVAMNLVELNFTLDAPIPRELPLSLQPTFDLRPWNGLVHNGRVQIALRQGTAQIGSVSILSQAFDNAFYEAQRKSAAS